MTKKYTLTTSEETVTENPEDIIRLMKLAGLTNAQPVAEEEVTEEVRDFANTPGGTDEEQLQLDPTDFEKKTGDGITKQKKSIQPSHGDNPLEYSLDENEIYEAMMKEFNEIEEVSEAQSPAQKAAFAKMLAAKGGKKEETVEETVEETDESIEESKGYKIRDKSRGYGVADATYKTREEAKYAAIMKAASNGGEWEVFEESKPDFLDLDKDGDKEESMKKAAKDKKEKADESVNEGKKDCDDCNWMKDETDGEVDTCDECAAEERQKAKKVANEETVTEDASVWSDFKKAHAEMDDDSEDRMFFSLKNWSGHRFEIQSDIEGENGTVLLGMHIANEDGETEFLQNRKFALSDIEANITGAGWYADGGELLKTTIGDFEGMDMEEEEVTEPNESSDMDRLRKLSGM